MFGLTTTCLSLGLKCYNSVTPWKECPAINLHALKVSASQNTGVWLIKRQKVMSDNKVSLQQILKCTWWNIFVWAWLCDYISNYYCSGKQNFCSKLPLKRQHKTVSPSFIASPDHLLSSPLCNFRGECWRAFGLIQCYLALLYESIKLMVLDQPRENAHKTETNWEIIVLVNLSKSSITHNVLNFFFLIQHKLSPPKYWWLVKRQTAMLNQTKRRQHFWHPNQIYWMANQNMNTTRSQIMLDLF